ncbi:MAG: hypothetical protein ACRDHZ_05955 [Ktedonobacteraceae bacterium]
MSISGSESHPAPSTPPEPLLHYDPQTNRWSGRNASFSIWMDHDTFCSYARVWYEWTTWRSDLSPQKRVAAAMAHCQRLAYWHGCERNFDYRIHITLH